MKLLHTLIIALTISLAFTSCSDQWADHYDTKSSVVSNTEIEVVNESIVDYLQKDTNLTNIYELFNQAKILERMRTDGQLMTVLVTDNSHIAKTMSRADVGTDIEYKAKSHVSDISLSPSNITNGQRILMWNGKYLNISLVTDLTNHGLSTIAFNGTEVEKIIKATNGYIYILKDEVSSPKSLYETIEGLGDEYSIFRDMILSKSQKVFDKEKSTPIGVDNTGNTIYDSVFTIRNPYFESVKFDLMSEALNATMLIPSNEVINKALAEAKTNLKTWRLERQDSILNNWIFQVAFFNTKLSSTDLTAPIGVEAQYPDYIDHNSIFGKQWRTTVQEVDVNDSIPLSNGIAYKITKMKIPTNVLIYRLKDYFKYYNDLSSADKEKYYINENLTYNSTKEMVPAWSGWPAGGFPKINNVIVRFTLTDEKETTPSWTYRLDFTPFKYSINESGYTAEEYLVPPGEYDLCMGFEQKCGYDIEVWFNDEKVNTVTTSQLTKSDFHYDRGGQGYPEGYDTKKATDKKKQNYDRDGGKVGVVTITGTQAKPVKITLIGKKMTKSSKVILHHWCLKPTVNCY